MTQKSLSIEQVATAFQEMSDAMSRVAFVFMERVVPAWGEIRRAAELEQAKKTSRRYQGIWMW